MVMMLLYFAKAQQSLMLLVRLVLTLVPNGVVVGSTADNTLRRADTICAGDTNAADAFDPSLEWEGFATGYLWWTWLTYSKL